MIDLLIFRIPAETEGEHTFAQLSITPEGLAEKGLVFHIEDEQDHYTSLKYNQLVFATACEGGSTNAQSITLTSESDPDAEVAVHQIPYADLKLIVDHVVPQLNSTKA